jgi:hypothetical protein
VEYAAIREAEAKAVRDSLPNPYIDEIENCRFLARYIGKIKKDLDKKAHA